jgi:hypothetical protein
MVHVGAMLNGMRFALAPIALVLFGCSASDDAVFTLYRNSAAGGDMRIHVATFDATDGESYNSENCRTALELFQRQPGVTVRYWCEKGRFRK